MYCQMSANGHRCRGLFLIKKKEKKNIQV